MAGEFTVVTQYPGILSLGGTQTQNGVFVGATTNANNIYFEFFVPQSIYSPSIVKASGTGWAQIADGLAAHPFVEGVQWTTQVNPANQLEVRWIISVSSTTGDSVANLEVWHHNIGPQLYAGPIADFHDQLDQAENQ